MPRRRDPRAAFGETIRGFREQLEISQEELAERAGLHRNYVGGIERCERNGALILRARRDRFGLGDDVAGYLDVHDAWKGSGVSRLPDV
jgi:transcriptional regulator with XRE-family HTH domain